MRTRSCLIPIIALVILLQTELLHAQGKLAIIIDDVGNNLSLGQRSAALPGNFTLAVLPFTPHGAELAEQGYRRGKEIMLHAPMSNEHNYPLGRGGLTVNMQQREFLKVLRENLANIPHIKGVNNHMGSLLTQKTEMMRWLMQELKVRNLYFVDSRTTTKTQALIIAEYIDLPSRRRDVFLDNDRNTTHIMRQLILALKKAQTTGSAIAIGHPYPETLSVLETIQPLLAQHGVELVSASVLMQTQALQTNVGYCLAPPSSLWPETTVPVDPFANENVTAWLVKLPAS